MAQITKDTIIGDILDIDESTAPIFVEQACMVHGVDVDALVKAVNEHIKDK